ncbi:(2Fe-2S)-binding protein [Salibacterium salarium]|uniref:(2Fe-2S)-binding protein n=1 Tax=Salibacterium salarium TaxID=284579 RepID=A0A3R9P887_9BACI|nr:(2Fe-2S)-binding protein [Salibacterium salarium]RSL33550.1 (2Fe-2S)-binding protein [Salibacterium salarium]
MISTSTIICRCEEITYGELLNTATNYQCSARELKLRTRAGMGICGGRTCRFLIEDIANTTNQLKQEPYTQVPLKHQPPVRPVSFQPDKEGNHNE